MLFKFSVLALGTACTVSAAVCERSGSSKGCNADYCLRALRATQVTRLPQASLDCTSALYVTVTPPVVTITEYSTTSVTNTVTIPTTLVETFYDTQTDVVPVTVTTDKFVAKRAPTISSISLPQYATWCSGIVRFSSACSCIGVTARTITAPTPSTTLTLPTTETSLTSIVEAVETTSLTITDATVSVTETTTVTVDSTPPGITGTAQVFYNGQFEDRYLAVFQPTGPNYSYGLLTTSLASAIKMRLDDNGQLWYGEQIAQGLWTNGGSDHSMVFIPLVQSTNRVPYTCSRNPATLVLSCALANIGVDLVFIWKITGVIHLAPRSQAEAAGDKIIDFILG